VAGKGNYPMAVRHDVENLIRRGNIFFWLARVSTSFVRCQPGSRLSLSLHCSDHKKAQAIGRKLNTVMAELKMKSKEPMSKAQLQKLCEHEQDVLAMGTHKEFQWPPTKPLKSCENPRHQVSHFWTCYFV